jgi:all-trans-8'-apo-beta-carotenal 15,15'-oxygenase
MNRRNFLSGASSAALLGATGIPFLARDAQATTPSIFKSEFAAAAANNPYLTPYRGAASDLYCESLVIEGKMPSELRGRFYRNGPAQFERGNERYQHWFDGDGMVQQFSFSHKGVSHRGRFVQTNKFKAESEAKEFLVPAFGTGIQPKRRITGPDSMNTANTNAIEHAGRVLAMWEGGSAFELDPTTLETKGAVTWKSGWEQMPFSAHPKLDPQGNLWNIGNSGDAFFVYHIDVTGKLAKTQVAKLPIDRKTHGGMSHDMAVTERFIIVPIPPVTLHFDQLALGKTGSDAAKIHKAAPLKIWVAPKDDVSKAQIFELPHEMVFHVGNAYERTSASGTEIVMQYVGSRNDNFLAGAAVAIMRGAHEDAGESHMRTVTMNLSTGKAQVATFDDSPEEFPRLDPRFIGKVAKHVVTPTSWRMRKNADHGFHAIQVRDVESGKTTRFDYGDDFIVEEHLVVAKPGGSRELDGWIVGTAFNAKQQKTCVSVFRADRVSDGPVARATLPYWLPLGFHGNFTPTQNQT